MITYLQVHAENTLDARSITVDGHSTNRQLFRLKRFHRLIRCHPWGDQVRDDSQKRANVGCSESEALNPALHFRVTLSVTRHVTQGRPLRPRVSKAWSVKHAPKTGGS